MPYTYLAMALATIFFIDNLALIGYYSQDYAFILPGLFPWYHVLDWVDLEAKFNLMFVICILMLY